MSHSWELRCSSCDTPSTAHPASTCASCGQPLFARHATVKAGTELASRWDLWRYSPFLPLGSGETPVSLGEGLTPLIDCAELATYAGVRKLYVKDEGQNPTGSFKARGMSVVATRARADGVEGIVAPTAGNAGAALAAYGAAAGLRVQIFAPRTTPRPILDTIEAMGATLERIDGHIGDAGRMAVEFAKSSGFLNVSTLREPYRVEGMKTMGFELAEQLGWTVPDVIVYPTGGGEGTVGIWKAIAELQSGGWLPAGAPQPSYLIAQASGCAPIVRAFEQQADSAEPWVNPVTHAAGLRVPGPFGDRLLLRIMRETGGAAVSVDEETIRATTRYFATHTGIDGAPEGGCALAALKAAVTQGTIAPDASVVIFNTGAGASYRA